MIFVFIDKNDTESIKSLAKKKLNVDVKTIVNALKNVDLDSGKIVPPILGMSSPIVLSATVIKKLENLGAKAALEKLIEQRGEGIDKGRTR